MRRRPSVLVWLGVPAQKKDKSNGASSALLSVRARRADASHGLTIKALDLAAPGKASVATGA
jgi:hypothetical protein